MNLLGLVFSLLLIFTYTFYACWDKQSSSAKLRTTQLAHQKANRRLLNSYQSEVYQSLRGKAVQTRAKKGSPTPQEVPPPPINPECAKINLLPLIEEGREAHPLLYEFTAKLLQNVYGPFPEKRFEYKFLDHFLEAAKISIQKENFLLEKIDLHEPTYQLAYYRMLKGTKESHTPSLLDYIKLEKTKCNICLFHAHPKMIELFFGSQVASSLFQEIHREKGSLLTKELVEKCCQEAHRFSLDPALLSLFDYGKPEHGNAKKTLLAEDRKADVYLRKNIYLKG
jgi:hypothetical protein